MSYQGDFIEDFPTFSFKFSTRNSDGPATLAGTPVISVYKDGGGTQSVAGVTLTPDFDATTGLNHILIDLSADAFYATGSNYDVVITAGTVNSVSVVGEVVGSFSIENRFEAIEEHADAVWDELLTGSFHNDNNSAGKRLRQLSDAGSYSGGFVYINTIDGEAGTVVGDNGTDVNPVDNIADANTIAAAIGSSKFDVSPASVVTFSATQSGQLFVGHAWTLALGGQDISNTLFVGCVVSGIGTTATGEATFRFCEVDGVTVGPTHVASGTLTGTFTVGNTGTYLFLGNSSEGGVWILETGSGIGNLVGHIHDFNGELEIQNLGQAGTDTLDITGSGELTINANCIPGGTIHLFGFW